MVAADRTSEQYVEAIRASNHTIYDTIAIGDPNFWIPAPLLERLLDDGLRGLDLNGLALRTRSKVVKEMVCRLLGYDVPKAFKKTQPRFPGQDLDVYTQKSNNLQVWNEELSATRRYVLVRISDASLVTRVKVVTGEALALLDTTGTLTQKYQARCNFGVADRELITSGDTKRLAPFLGPLAGPILRDLSPVRQPHVGELLPIAVIFERLAELIGRTMANAGVDQERNRGAGLHRLVCEALGYGSYQDDGQFPDVRHQLLEVKLQTSPTIDLGLVRPDSFDPLDVPMLEGQQVRHCDVRYAVFGAVIEGAQVRITHLVLVTGEGFFGRFQQFGGKVLNAKLQIPLPANFFA